jgi:hypothetical protein
VIGVQLTDAADTVRRQKLVFVQQPFQHQHQTFAIP